MSRCEVTGPATGALAFSDGAAITWLVVSIALDDDPTAALIVFNAAGFATLAVATSVGERGTAGLAGVAAFRCVLADVVSVVSLFFTVEDVVARAFLDSAWALFVSGVAAGLLSALVRVFLDDLLLDCMEIF